MLKYIRYENGLRAVVETNESVRSVSVGYWVGVGSSNESAEINGLSHFTEHMMFKGTDKLDAFGIANEFESMGASINAFTSKDCTCYYFKVIDESKEKCFELLSSIMFDSTFDSGELDKERKVIIEEINMVEDAPDDICYDLVSKAAFGDSGLGQTILGSYDNVKRFDRNDVISFMDDFYCADNIVLSFSGNITEDEVNEYVARYVMGKIREQKSKKTGILTSFMPHGVAERVKDFEQSNLAIAFKGIEFENQNADKQRMLSLILGGGMSSRLFQSIREQQGLAYSVYTVGTYQNTHGLFNFLLNYSVANTQKILDATAVEIRKVLDGDIKQSELDRAKTLVKTSLIFSREKSDSTMVSNGKLAILRDKLFDFDKAIDGINSVTLDDVNDMAQKIFDPNNMYVAYVGKQHDVDLSKFSFKK